MISIKNITLLLAVLIAGFCLVSSVSAMDIDESGSLTDSSDLSSSSVSVDSVDISSDSSNDISSVPVEDSSSDSNAGAVETPDASSSNVNLENEVLNADDIIEDSKAVSNKKTKNLLSNAGATLEAGKVKTTLIGSSSTLYKGSNYVLTLTDANGKALKGLKLSYTIAGKTYTLTTDAKGSTYLQINLKEGNYTMVCSFAGSNTYNPANFTTTLNVMRKPNSYSISEIEAAAQTVKSYVAKNKKLPSTVKVGPKKLKISEFAYLASKAIANLNANNKNDIVLLKNIKNCKSSTVSLKTKVLRAQYVTIAKNVAKAIKNKKVPPTATAVKNNRKRTVGKASFNLYTFEFAKILVYHKKNDVLAKSCTFSTDVFKKTSAQKATVLKGSNNTLVRGTNYVLTLTDSNGKVLKGQKLSYFVNGKTYTLTTDAKGSTYLQINLKEGKYTMVCSFAGTKTYKAAKKTVLLTVLKKTNSVSVSAVERAAANVKAYVNANKQLPSYSNSG